MELLPFIPFLFVLLVAFVFARRKIHAWAKRKAIENAATRPQGFQSSWLMLTHWWFDGLLFLFCYYILVLITNLLFPNL